MSPSLPLQPHRQATRVLADLGLALALALALGLSLAAGSASAQSATTPPLGARSEVHDLYTPSGPIVDGDVQTGRRAGILTSERWRAGSSDFRQGGLAHAKQAWSNQTLVAGTSALARSDSGYNGWAQATLRADFGIRVILAPPENALVAGVWEDLMLLAGCGDGDGCVFDVSFLHQTRGRFAHANRSGDRSASFEELLTLRSTLPDGLQEVTTGGHVGLQLRNLQSTAQVSVSGDWSTGDLYPFGPTPASQLGLYPTGDGRNTLDDPAGDLQGWNFSHSEVLRVPIHFKLFETNTIAEGAPLSGRIDVRLEQVATAGAGPFVYSSSTLSVDFADTSTFSFAQITDPAGIVDFSQARVSLVAAPVPEPHAAWLALGGLALLWARRRDRGSPQNPRRAPG